MSRRAVVGALVLALVILVAPPAAAKGPTEVAVHDPRTGDTVLLDFADRGEMEALQLMVGWPRTRKKPRVVGELVHVATLTWQYGDGMLAWTDRIYSDDTGTGWVRRRDHLSGTGAVVWGHTSTYGIEAVLAQIQDPGEDTTTTLVTSAAGSTRVAAPQRERGLEGESFAMGAVLAGLLAAGLARVVARRGQRGTRPERGPQPSRT